MASKIKMTKEEKMFGHDPVWKTLLKMAAPSVIIMLVFGSYFFFDNILSINFAADSYEKNGQLKSDYYIPGMDGSTLVRIFMNGYSPINSLMMALTLLFGLGISTRVAINLGKKNKERAKKTFKTGFMAGMIMSLLLMPVLILTSQAWIEGQYNSFDPHSKHIIGNTAFKYAWPVIMSLPLMMFNQITSSMLRTEARTKEMMIALISPIFINLLLDWVFMGPAGLGVEGGAWATFISTAITTLILLILISKSNETSLIKWKIFFGKKVQLLTLVGVILVGVAPFLRNMSQSITSSIQTNILNEVSSKVYYDDFHHWWVGLTHKQQTGILVGSTHKPGILDLIRSSNHSAWNHFVNNINLSQYKILNLDHPAPLLQGDKVTIAKNIISNYQVAPVGNPLHQTIFINSILSKQAKSTMISIMSGAMPVFILFFPIMFAFAQAARPVASFNYGAKKFNRVREVYFWTILFSLTTSILIYFLVAWGISGGLIDLLKISKNGAVDLKAEAQKTLKIIMLSMIGFAFAIGAMTIFGSTDRIISSILTSSLRGLILFWPVIYSFKEIAIENPSNNFLFAWYLPVVAGVTSLVATIMVLKTLITINRKYQVTLDDRIDYVYKIHQNFLEKRANFKQAKIDGSLDQAKAEWKNKKIEHKKQTKAWLIEQQEIVDKKYKLYKAKKLKGN